MPMIVNPRGRPPRQLEWGEGDGGLSPVETVPIQAMAGFTRELTEQPSVKSSYGDWQRPIIDPKGHTHVRIICDIVEPGASTAVLLLEARKLDTLIGTCQSPGQLLAPEWRTPASGDQHPFVTLYSSGPQAGPWYPLDERIVGDWAWQVVASGGNGLESPRLGYVAIQFDRQARIEGERLYWRDLVPSVVPCPVPNVYPHVDSDGDQEPWSDLVGPTPEQVRTTPKVLSATKATYQDPWTSVITTVPSPNYHTGQSGPVLRFVGAPLLRQRVPAFEYRHAFSSHTLGGSGNCFVECRVYIWRAATDSLELVAEARPDAILATWSRYQYRMHIQRAQGRAFVAEAQDRFVVDVGVYYEPWYGYFNKVDQVEVGYNGTDDDFTEDFLPAGHTSASYTFLPALRYLSPLP